MEIKRISELPLTQLADNSTHIPIEKDGNNYKIKAFDLVKQELDVFNISKHIPITGYYTSISARLSTPVNVRHKGVIIIYESSDKEWKEMQYLGGEWLDESSWKFSETVGNVVTLEGSQTITGEKTFSILPKANIAPSSNTQLVNKKYVDDSILSWHNNKIYKGNILIGSIGFSIGLVSFIALPIRSESILLWSIEYTGGNGDATYSPPEIPYLNVITRRVGSTGFNVVLQRYSGATNTSPAVFNDVYINYVIIW